MEFCNRRQMFRRKRDLIWVFLWILNEQEIYVRIISTLEHCHLTLRARLFIRHENIIKLATLFRKNVIYAYIELKSNFVHVLRIKPRFGSFSLTFFRLNCNKKLEANFKNRYAKTKLSAIHLIRASPNVYYYSSANKIWKLYFIRIM